MAVFVSSLMYVVFLAYLSLESISAREEQHIRGASMASADASEGFSVGNFFHRFLSLKTDWYTSESVVTSNGAVPRTTCPIGRYRTQGGTDLVTVKGGLRVDGCMPCGRGYYGDAVGQTLSTCTSPCPLGRYNDRLGATSEGECKYCPKGKYGSTTGLRTRACTADCPAGRYTASIGNTASADCLECPNGYSMSQFRSEKGCEQSNLAFMNPRNGE